MSGKLKKKDSKKEKLRFLKKIIIYNLIMSTIVTLAALYVSYLARDITGSVVAPLCGLWGIELGLSAWIKITEGREVQENKTERKNDESSPFEDQSI